MPKYPLFILLFLLFFVINSHAQTDTNVIKQFIRIQAGILCADNMHGRGYVMDGRQVAAAWLQGKFKELGLKPAPGNYVYTQPYYFPVNTFPGKMKLSVNGKELKAGADYIIDAGSPSYASKKLSVTTVDMGGVTDLDGLKTAFRQFDGGNAYLLLNTDSMCKALGAHMEEIAMVLPEGCYIIPQKRKLTWTVAEKAIKATVFYVKEDALPA